MPSLIKFFTEGQNKNTFFTDIMEKYNVEALKD